MDFRAFETPRLQKFHARVRDRLAKDDANRNARKPFGIRSDPDWRRASDAIEAELQRRAVPVQRIDWSDPPPALELQLQLEHELDSPQPSVIHHDELLLQFFTYHYLDWAKHNLVLRENESEDAIFISARIVRVLEEIVGAERLHDFLACWADQENIEILGPHKLLRAEEPCVKVLGFMVQTELQHGKSVGKLT
jgi:hypothetical protein